MSTLVIVETGANGQAHNYSDVATIATQIKTWANTDKIDYVNLQDDGIRTGKIRAHSGPLHGRTLVRNGTGSAMSAGDLVYFSEEYATDSIPNVTLANATAGTDLRANAIVTESIANDANGTVATQYELSAVNTSAGSVGDPVFLSTTAGGWTLTEPSGTNMIQVIGSIFVDNASTGRIAFNINPGSVTDTVIGANDLGHDFQVFGATSGAYMLWDESTDDLVLAGAAQLYLFDAGGGEHLSSDGTDLTINSGNNINLTCAAGDVIIPANIGLTFGAGEKIEGNDTNLTVTSGGDIKLTATTDVVIPANVGVTFGTGEKIEGDDTNLTITSGGAINLTATTVTGSGVLSIDDTTDSSSATTGSIHTDGGLGVAKDIYLGDDLLIATGAVFNWAGDDVTLTHSAGKLTFGGDDAVEIDFNNHEMTNVDINSGAIDGTVIGAASVAAGSFAAIVGTTLTASGASQFNSTVTVGVDDAGYDVKFFGATASAYCLWDASIDDLILAGAAGLTVAGTSALTVLTASGTSQFNSTVTVGVDDAGHDVKFFGATASAHMLWDASIDDLILAGAAGLTVAGTSALTVLTASTITGSGVLSIEDTTASTSGTTGSIQTDGGLGVVLDIFTNATLNAAGDTAAGDKAAMGYTSAEGLILTGQGSSFDITLKNDADANVLTVATGTTTVTLPGVLSIDDATDSTSTTTGSIHTDGGIGVAKNIIVGVNVGIGEATPDEMLHLTSSVSQGTKIKLEDTNAGADSAVFEFNKNSSSPADNDSLGEIEFRGNNSTPSEYRYGRIFCKSTDVTAGTENSEMSFNVFSNGASKVGTLSTLGVWTDESGAKGKAYEGAPKEVWQGGVLDRIKNLFVSRYHHAHIPEWKEILERHISPSAEDFYDLFGAGTDPRKIRKNQKGQDIVPVPGIAPKDLAGVALIGIQELIDEVDVMKSEIAALKEMA